MSRFVLVTAFPRSDAQMLRCSGVVRFPSRFGSDSGKRAEKSIAVS